MAKKEKVIVAYKAFDKDLKCRDFQYEIGKTYEHDGEVKACNSGFHSCELPMDIFNYYPLDSRFARVEAAGTIARHGDDSKIASAKITIVAEIALPEIIKSTVDFVISQCKKAKKNIVNGKGKSAASSGDSSKAASSGDSSTAASSGDSSTAASSGNSSTAASSGNYSKAASSGNYSKAASSGDSSTAASSGYSSTAASSGDSSTAASSGNSSQVSCDTNGFACVAGLGGSVKGNNGSALSLGYKDSNGKLRIMVAYVGEDGIKENTWYRVEDGKIVEA